MDSATSTAPAGAGPRLLALIRRQPGLTAMIVMALVGLAISIYLTVVHYDTKVSLICTTGGLINCQQVTSSAYSVIPGTPIPITIPGMLWFLVSGGMALVALRAVTRGVAEPARLRLAHLLWAAAGLLYVLYLVFAEIALVQRICEWCTVVHLLTLATFCVALTRWQRRDEGDMLEEAPAPRAARPRAPQQALSRRTRQSLSQRGKRGR